VRLGGRAARHGLGDLRPGQCDSCNGPEARDTGRMHGNCLMFKKMI